MADLSDIAKKLDIEPTNRDNKRSKNIISVESRKRRTWLEDEIVEQVTLIDPTDICNWEFHDRPEEELGDIKGLADEFVKIGQQQPCIVRPTKTGVSKYKYELIIGERRWRAATLANIKLKAIIKDINDSDSALAQAAENDNRKDLSDYAKGMSYAKLINNNIIEQKDLIERLGKSRQYISALLSYSNIPQEVADSILDLSKVSCRTAETIKRLSQKGDDYRKAIIEKSDLIREGKIGHQKLTDYVEKQVRFKVDNNSANELKAKKIISANGRHLFTIRKDNNNLSSLHFPKDISDLLKSNKINSNLFNEKIMGLIENELSNLK
ncbi:ParB/RepB/Spo0J family partition protein [Francisellaceae bacterium CB52]